MGELFIRDLDDAILTQLKRRAWESGLPLEEYLRRLIISDVRSDREQSQSGIAVRPLHPLHESEARRPMVLHS